ncbi:MBL fold metallo-hydrolase [Kribbella sp.]|uniref:MBL fold metallo-hydrolase n=1 Tax=Kribbella sp. TaxID=1871183 RepID=UPI002D52908C|nr:MBL fold metallo-hydrolase [Kribbella sp.]HZX02171.1 MBL fold metallo-hydrolase [Kribbella sp.]
MRVSRRGMLTGAAAVGAAGVIGFEGQATAEVEREPVELTWFGTHAWEIRCGKSVVLTDPWLTRFKTGTFTPEGADPKTKLVIDPKVVDKHVSTADVILVHHGHYDHLADVPYVGKRTQATVLCTETHANLLRAMKTPDDLLSPVRGGEYLPFDGFAIEVFPSLHSCGGKRHTYAYPGYRYAVPLRPRVIEDLVEGGTLAFVITIGGLRILSLSTANFDPNALRDLQVDVVLAAPGGEPGITDRLLRTIKPVRKVIATHWDDFDKPLDEPGVPWTDLTPLRTSVQKTGAEFVVLDHLQKVTL